jgi:hypothetical protein
MYTFSPQRLARPRHMSECLTESQRNLWLGYDRDAQPWAGPTALTCGRVDQTRLLPHAELLAPSDPRRLRAVEVSVDQEECVRREREIDRERSMEEGREGAGGNTWGGGRLRVDVASSTHAEHVDGHAARVPIDSPRVLTNSFTKLDIYYLFRIPRQIAVKCTIVT